MEAQPSQKKKEKKKKFIRTYHKGGYYNKSEMTILAEMDQAKTETGLVCYETYQFVSILLVDYKL